MLSSNEQLLYERYSAFEHDTWDREEWLRLLNYSPTINQDHTRQLQQYGYSFLQDSFYALKGATPNSSLLGEIWRKVVGDATFQMLSPLLKDINTTATVVTELAKRVARLYSRAVENNKEKLLDEKTEGVHIPEKPHLEELDEKAEGLITIDACLWALLDGKPQDKRAEVEATHDLFDAESFSKVLGWAQRTVSTEARKGASTSGELTGYEAGGFSANVIPRDMVGLAKKKKPTMIDMAQNQLTVRKYSSTEPLGRGPCIILRDVTGSMTSMDGDASRHQKALGIEIALAKAFNEQNRDLVSIVWSSSTCKKYTYGEKGWKDHVTVSPNGSTIIDKSLSVAVETATDYVPNSDILVISDGFLDHHAATTGFDHFDAMLKPFRDRGGKVWAILLAGQSVITQIEEVWGWVDGWITVESLANIDAMTGIIGSMARPRGNDGAKRLI